MSRSGSWLLMLLTPVLVSADTNRLIELVHQAADHHRQGRYQEAEAASAAAATLLETSKDVLPGFDAAASWNDLAVLAYAQGQLDRAAQFFQRSQKGYEGLARPDDARRATVLYNLAGVYLELGRYAEAEPLLLRALEIREKTLSPVHPLVAEVSNNLGFLYLQQGKNREAERFLERALAVWERFAGSYAAPAAVALNNLALLRRREGAFDKSESAYKLALGLERNALGQDHPEVATTMLNLAALYRARGSTDQAMETYRQAAALLEEKLGGQDPLAIEAREQLGEVSGSQGQSGEYQILLARTKEEAETLRTRVERGEKFAELATRHSIDPSASNGGYFRGRVSEFREELRAELSRLGAGQVSAVFPLAGNWAIVKKVSEPPARK
jgi:tetratricopeptide (TPR) repeat protein